MDVFNRLIKLKILFLIHVKQLSTTALANIKLELHGCRLCKILKALLYETMKRDMDDSSASGLKLECNGQLHLVIPQIMVEEYKYYGSHRIVKSIFRVYIFVLAGIVFHELVNSSS